MLERFFEVVLSEYGVFVAFLLLTIVALSYTIKVLWKRIGVLEDTLLGSLQNNTKIITQLVTKLDADNDGH